MCRIIAMRTPSGLRAITLANGEIALNEFEATYAVPAIVADMIAEGDIETIDGPFCDMSYDRGAARTYDDLEALAADLPDNCSALSIYDAVGCIHDEIIGWNLLASDSGTLVNECDAKGPWIHLKVGLAQELPIAA